MDFDTLRFQALKRMEDRRTQDELRRRHRGGDPKVKIAYGLSPDLIRQGYLIKISKGTLHNRPLHIHRLKGEYVQGRMCDTDGQVPDPWYWMRNIEQVVHWSQYILPNLDRLCGTCQRRRNWPTWEDEDVLEMEPMQRVYTEGET